MKVDIKNIAITIGACMTITTGIGYFATPAIDNHIRAIVKDYNSGVENKAIQKQLAQEIFNEFLDSNQFNVKLDEYLDRVNSNSVSLRKLLSIKMGVPQETVADELAELYTKDRKRLRKLLREINRMYPDLNVWEID